MKLCPSPFLLDLEYEKSSVTWQKGPGGICQFSGRLKADTHYAAERSGDKPSVHDSFCDSIQHASVMTSIRVKPFDISVWRRLC